MKRNLKLLLTIALGVIVFVYFLIYFQKGSVIEEEFFRVVKENSTITYYGQLFALETSIEINEILPQGYQVDYSTSKGNREFVIEYQELVPGLYKVRVLENNSVLFSGRYNSSKGNAFKLLDDKGEFYLSLSQGFIENEDRVITYSDFILYKIIIGLALKDYPIVFRGQITSFIMACIFIGLFILGMISPEMLSWLTKRSYHGNSEYSSDSHMIRMVVIGFLSISCLLSSII